MAALFVLLLSSCFLLQINSGRAHEGFTRSETLAKGYILKWAVDSENSKIEFLVRVLTLGYVGFGINPTKGAMDGADMVIGGVYDNGTSYFTDGHGVGNNFVKDKSQDWILLDAFESDGWTTLKLERPLQTCDQEDIRITDDTMRVIYSYGETDQAEYHKDNRGSQSLQLLNPNSRVREDTSGFNAYNISVNMKLPDDGTVYWISVHCFPDFKSKAHIVGYEPMLSTVEAKKHVHHMLGFRCTTPEDPLHAAQLQALSNTPGGPQEDPSLQIASQYCIDYVFGWDVGGYPIFFPDDIGVPLGRRDKQECFRIETHVHNPQKVKGLEIKTGMTLYYTEELRKYDGGGLTVGTRFAPHLIVPPKVKDFIHTGHCSSECTNAAFPQGGTKIFGVTPHTHTHECVYDTTEATHQGQSTAQEMCLVFFFVYPLVQDLSYCVSVLWPPEDVLHPLGIGSLNSSEIDPIITSPPEMKGLTLLDALNHKVNWTDEKVNNLQDQMRWKKQMSVCAGEQTANFVPGVSYPTNFKAYEPKLTCQKSSSGAETALMMGSLLPMAILVAILVGRRIAYI